MLAYPYVDPPVVRTVEGSFPGRSRSVRLGFPVRPPNLAGNQKGGHTRLALPSPSEDGSWRTEGGETVTNGQEKGGTWIGWLRFGSQPTARWRSDPQDLPRSNDVSWNQADPTPRGAERRQTWDVVSSTPSRPSACEMEVYDPFHERRGAVLSVTAIHPNRTRPHLAWQERSHPSPPATIQSPSTTHLSSTSACTDATHIRGTANGHRCGDFGSSSLRWCTLS